MPVSFPENSGTGARLLVDALKVHGEWVETTRDFAPALERDMQAGRRARIEVRLAPEALSPSARLSELRAQALARLVR